jgi:hypothetical protein
MGNDFIVGLFFLWICISNVFIFILMSVNNLNKDATDALSKICESLDDSVLDLAKEVAKLREEVDKINKEVYNKEEGNCG